MTLHTRRKVSKIPTCCGKNASKITYVDGLADDTNLLAALLGLQVNLKHISFELIINIAIFCLVHLNIITMRASRILKELFIRIIFGPDGILLKASSISD